MKTFLRLLLFPLKVVRFLLCFVLGAVLTVMISVLAFLFVMVAGLAVVGFLVLAFMLDLDLGPPDWLLEHVARLSKKREAGK